MTLSRLAPLTAAQDGDALELLDRAFADDPSLAWYLHADRPDYAARRRAYLASYQRFHRANRLMTLAAWQAGRLVGVCYFSGPGQVPSDASLLQIGQAIREQCGEACLARLDHLIEAFEHHLGAAGDQARIEFIGVVPELHGQGIGSALLRQCLTQLKADGCNRVALETAAPRNLALYRRHGFEQTGSLSLDGLHQRYLQRTC